MHHDPDFALSLAAIRARFVEKLGRWMPKYLELSEMLEALDRRGPMIALAQGVSEGPRPVELIGELRMQTHKIAGSAQTFGFEVLSQRARELEERFDQGGPPAADLTLRALLERFISAAREVLEAAKGAPDAAPAAARQEAPAQAALPEAAGPAAAAGTGVHVLVVDDDELVRDLLGAGFAEMGWRMSTAKTGLEALLMLFACAGGPAAGRPDVILMDVNMPEMDGFCALERIKAAPLWREIPILLLTRRDEETSQIRGFLHGAEAYLIKPFDLGEVVRRVADTLDARARTVVVGCADLERGVRLSQRLRGAGGRVRLVHSSADAWEALTEERPVAALLEADLRGEGGAAVLARARASADLERLPILLVLPELAPEALLEASLAGLAAGASDVLPADTPPAWLAARLEAYARAAKPG
ncbi:hypothetical protein LPB142_12440 [Rhodobacter xanthinilyticus]|uniref:Response regulatory domain-containing protein n=1 Tax=Rhodobacter xanthinilyticus TaxID=1850250 RepID=A0A1D9ME63_9RHOB|nr:response regulator [Rhodobacter xanthinilyticus]AOZ70029.1 hypothetical protein LPB142_12440 [Rhodobacter xanthinilyticus]